MDKTLAEHLKAAIAAVDEAVASHEVGDDAPYSVPFLRQVRNELTQMQEQWPSFPFRFGRFLLDWPESKLGTRLLKVGHLFERLQKRAINDR